VKGVNENFTPFTFSKIKLKIISIKKYKIFKFGYKQFEDENLRRSKF